MAYEHFLPSAVMTNMFSFLDPCDLAHMSQTCKTWKRIVYRKSVWENFNVTYRDFPDLIYKVPPRGARHIGSLSHTCFLNWLCNDPLTVNIMHMYNQKEFIAKARRYWHRCGSPCLIKDHHNIHDLLMVSLSESFSKTDAKRILCRIISISSKKNLNAYAHYIELQQQHLRHMLHLPHVTSDDEHSSDPLHRLRFATLSMQRLRMMEINTQLSSAYNKLDECKNAIMYHGISEFASNDIWYSSNYEAVWNIAGFSYKIK
jgi:hypothetical protein